MVYIPNHLKKKRVVKITKNFLVNFEKEIFVDYNLGKIKGPIHLSNGNEKELINIFRYINHKDWVFSNWRNHYHALLHGLDPEKVKKFIYEGKSMSVSCKNKNFLSSSIVNGTIPIALGVAIALKKDKKKEKVWCFLGDMAGESGVFYEAYKYSINFNLPITFIIEDNNLSTNSPTNIVWGRKKFDNNLFSKAIYYKYKNKYPHHGTGKWVTF